MEITEAIINELIRPFPAHAVKFRLGKLAKAAKRGMALAYVDARDVMDRLDEIVGVSNWQCRHEVAANGSVVCHLGIRIHGEWIWKSDGAGQTAVEPEKGALSDALKRAAVQFGIGRQLYGIDNTWVNITPRGNSWVMAEGEEDRLRTAYETGVRDIHSPEDAEVPETGGNTAYSPSQGTSGFDPEARKANFEGVPPERQAPSADNLPGGDLIKELAIYRRAFSVAEAMHGKSECDSNPKAKFWGIDEAKKRAKLAGKVNDFKIYEVRKLDAALSEIESEVQSSMPSQEPVDYPDADESVPF